MKKKVVAVLPPRTAGSVALTAPERETVVTVTDDDAVVRIWTAQRTVITRLHKHPSFTLVKTGTFGGSPWAEFTIPADQWTPATGAKRKGHTQTPEQRAASAQRLAAVRRAPRTTTPTNA